MFSQVGRSPFIAMGITLLLLLLLLGFFRFKLVLRWLCWYFVGISLAALVFSLVVIPSLNIDGK